MLQAVSAALDAVTGAVPHAAVDALGTDVPLVRAGLVDLDVTFFIQTLFFLALVFILPKLIFEPLMERLGQRDTRTSGARDDAKRMLKDADAQVLIFEKATSEQKQVALAERAAARESAQQKAGELLDKVRADTDARVEAGIAELRSDAETGRAQVDADATAIAAEIAEKILTGGSATRAAH